MFISMTIQIHLQLIFLHSQCGVKIYYDHSVIIIQETCQVQKPIYKTKLQR